jgi:hypothetical protein
MPIATCIGCGCDDYHACQSDDGPCSWLMVDYGIGRGVCSCCEDNLARWKAGERSFSMLVAKITKEGDVEPFFIERNDMDFFPLHFEVEAGDRFTVEWVEMTSEAFEALPQFEHVRLARRWLVECAAADNASFAGDREKARQHRQEATRLADIVSAAGYDVVELAEF